MPVDMNNLAALLGIQQPALERSKLRGTRADELQDRVNNGGDARDRALLGDVNNDIATDPDTGEAAQKNVRDVESQIHDEAMYARPEAHQRREEDKANQLEMMLAPIMEKNRGEVEKQRIANEGLAEVAGIKNNGAASGTQVQQSYRYHQGRLDKLSAPLVTKADRFATVTDSLNARTPQADALVAPEVLSVLAGGQGSGVRINEAEIARVIGGRTELENLKAAMNKYQLDPSKGLSITDAQRQQIHSLLSTVQSRVHSKLSAIDQANQDLASAPDINSHRQIVNGLQHAINAIDSGGDAGAGDQQDVITDPNWGAR